MQNLMKRLYKNSFFRSIATLMSGTIIAQVISFAISPLMTRLYSEEQIGEYTLLLTVVTMFGSVICGRYDMAIVGESDEKGMYGLYNTCVEHISQCGLYDLFLHLRQHRNGFS